MNNTDVVRMANQMASFFNSYGKEEGSKELATHINYFWEPPLREQFLKMVVTSANLFDPLVITASLRVVDPRIKKPVIQEAQDPKTRLPKEATEA